MKDLSRGHSAAVDLDSTGGTAQWRDPISVAEYHHFADGKFWLGRCPVTGTPLGHLDDRHVMLVSGTRAGKGTDIIIPNLCLWPGSAIVIDPKGENATITAARRGDGSDYCEGMGQSVYVVDPFRVAHVDEKYRARFNPLDALDVTADDFTTKLKAVGIALMPSKKEESDPIWTKLGRRLLTELIMHVLTCEDFEGRRNLVTVRRLMTLGDYDLYKTLVDAGEKDIPSGMSLLWESMRMNDALGGAVSAAGQRYIDNMKNNPKRNEDILLNVREETDFIDAGQFARSLASSDFSLDEIKNAPNGTTIYLCLPFDQIDAYFPWLRLNITLAMNAVQVDDTLPACGHRTLFCLDEFAALERMKNVESSISQIAGYHVTMFLVLQSLKQLKAIYGDGWEVILANCALKIFFGVGGEHFTTDYISKLMGEREVRRNTRSITATASHAVGATTSSQLTESESESHGKTHTDNRSRTNTVNQTLTSSIQRTNSLAEQQTRSKSRTKTKQDSISNSETHTSALGGGESNQWSENWSKTLGKNRGVSTSENTSWNKGKGGGSGKSESWANPGHGILGDTGHYLPMLRENESVNYQTQENWSDGRGGGTTKGESSGTNESDSAGGSHGGGANTSWTESDAIGGTVGQSLSDGETDGISLGTTKSASEGTTDGRSESKSIAEQVGTSDAVSHTRQTGVARSTGKADSVTDTVALAEGNNESIHKRPLLTGPEIGIWFGRVDEESKPGEPGWALVLLDGESPAVVHRSPYFRDVGFQWLFDPHPKYEPRPKLMGSILEPVPPVNVPELVRYAPTVSWLVEEGAEVQRGEILFTLGLPPPARFLRPNFIEAHAAEVGDLVAAVSGEENLTAAKLSVPVFSPATGTLSKQTFRAVETEDGLESCVDIVGNRRHHLEAQDVELPIPMIDYFKYLKELHAQQREEEEAQREREQAEQETRAREEAAAATQRRREETRHKKTLAEQEAVRVAAREERLVQAAKEAWWREQNQKYEPVFRVFVVSIAALILGVLWPVIVHDRGIFRDRSGPKYLATDFTIVDLVDQIDYADTSLADLEQWIKNESLGGVKDLYETWLPERKAECEQLLLTLEETSAETVNIGKSKLSIFLLAFPFLAAVIAIGICLFRGEFRRYLSVDKDRWWDWHTSQVYREPYITAQRAQLKES